jgi:hypothetical protein
MSQAHKKTEKLEIRLSPEAKDSFRTICRAQGGSASEVVRALITARWIQTLGLRDLTTPQRAMIVACGITAAVLGATSAAAAAVALLEDMRLGLTVFLGVQGAGYAATALCAFKLRWRTLGGLLLGQGLMQIVYGAETTPRAPALDTMSGLVFGMLGPTLAVALISAIAWIVFRQGLLRPKR